MYERLELQMRDTNSSPVLSLSRSLSLLSSLGWLEQEVDVCPTQARLDTWVNISYLVITAGKHGPLLSCRDGDGDGTQCPDTLPGVFSGASLYHSIALQCVAGCRDNSVFVPKTTNCGISSG